MNLKQGIIFDMHCLFQAAGHQVTGVLDGGCFVRVCAGPNFYHAEFRDDDSYTVIRHNGIDVQEIRLFDWMKQVGIDHGQTMSCPNPAFLPSAGYWAGWHEVAGSK